MLTKGNARQKCVCGQFSGSNRYFKMCVMLTFFEMGNRFQQIFSVAWLHPCRETFCETKCFVCCVLVCLLATIKMSTNSERDLNTKSGHIQIDSDAAGDDYWRSWWWWWPWSWKSVSVGQLYIYIVYILQSAFTLCKSIELDIQKHFAQKCPTFLLEFPILHI